MMAAYVKKEEDPAKVMNGLLKADSPYMKLAETEGKQAAQRRGLLSSSMGVGAVADSRARAALPLAQQTSQQNFGANQSNQGFEQSRTLQSDSIKAQADLEKQRRDLELTMQNRQLTAAEQSQLRDIKSREGMLGTEIASREGMQAKEIGANTQERAYDRQLQTKLASWNLDAAQQNDAMQALTNATAAYEQGIATINSNPKLKADDREKQIKALAARREKSVNLVRQIFDVDIRF